MNMLHRIAKPGYKPNGDYSVELGGTWRLYDVPPVHPTCRHATYCECYDEVEGPWDRVLVPDTK